MTCGCGDNTPRHEVSGMTTTPAHTEPIGAVYDPIVFNSTKGRPTKCSRFGVKLLGIHYEQAKKLEYKLGNCLGYAKIYIPAENKWYNTYLEDIKFYCGNDGVTGSLCVFFDLPQCETETYNRFNIESSNWFYNATMEVYCDILPVNTHH